MTRPIPFHPLLAALVPVLLLVSANADKAPPAVALRTAGIAVGLALVLWAVMALALRSIYRAAAPTTLVVFFGATLLPASRALASMTNLEQSVYRWPIGAALALGALLLMAFVMRKMLSHQDHGNLTRGFNAVVICLAIVPGSNITRVALADSPESEVVSPPQIDVTRAQNLPDIYYIIPDGYGRADVLEEMYGLDNSPFLRQLEALGFVVCGESTANYCQTVLSVTSAFNMSHISPPDGDIASASHSAGYQATMDNAVMKTLKRAGYTTVAHGSGYTFSELHSADTHHAPGPNEFEVAAGWTFLGPVWRYLTDQLALTVTHYARTTRTLALLGHERRRDEPIFVFAHLIAPHPPFVFNRDGTERSAVHEEMRDGSHVIPRLIAAEDYRADYARQVQGLNLHLLEAVRRIINASDGPCIIIIQGDHGPRSEVRWEDTEGTNVREAMGILNAYLVPEDVQERLYPEITPVNSFRLVLSHVLGTEIPLTDDTAFFSTWSRPYDFIDVTQRVRDGELTDAPRSES